MPTGGWLRNRLQSAFVVAQVAVALMLLSGAGLLIKSFMQLVKVNPGFQADGLLVARIALSDEYGEDNRQVNYFQELTNRLKSLPGVNEAGAATVLPMNPFGIDFDVPYHRAEQAEPPRAAAPKARFRAATPEYFRALGMPVNKGRDFVEHDRQNSPRVVIVNQMLAESVWPRENPVGKQLRFFWADWQTYEVVGVVGNTKSYGLAENWQPELFVPEAQIPYNQRLTSFEIVGIARNVKSAGLNAESEPAYFVPATQAPLQDMVVLVRASGDPVALVPAIRTAVRSIDASQPISNISTMEKIVADSIGQPRLSMTLMGLFGALALILAAVGIYGLLSYAVTQRTQEMGIRMALGASTPDVLKLILRQGMILALMGIALGLFGSFALTRLIGGLLFGVTPTDATTFIAVSGVLIGVSLLACYFPARRATKVDPLVALRYE